MKQLLFLIATLFVFSCSNDDNVHTSQVATGSNTATLIFDGKKMMGSAISNAPQDFLVDVSKQQVWVFVKLSNGDEFVTFNLFSNIELEEGKTYAIKGNLNSNVKAVNEHYGSNVQYIGCSTNEEVGGSITITKLDYKSRIIGAAFTYDTVDDKGVIHTIRNGWFDLKF
ncbi:hypothetical protein H1R17_02035 [Flavobacterium sp. xlx-214]|uniref:hypothetical protein n=1 Tax=unclassified Flavobacterium TaxID=196869 RepID=UPI0013D3196A|nr:MULTISPECIES: hypothetical protein [unclassified Flavobacterium]MBA5792803.1 hypothetical protein [Flavobacterium sp. xlx-221]QMI83939.1 hypothetical protein H1R17_02035 [Flavobacterium sp. xlx-214]